MYLIVHVVSLFVGKHIDIQNYNFNTSKNQVEKAHHT